MTISAVADTSGQFHARRPGYGHGRRQPRRASTAMPGYADHPVEHLFPRSSPGTSTAERDVRPVSAPGVIGGAVIRAARRSVRITIQRLARILSLSPVIVRSLENGNTPLYRVNYTQICGLADVFAQAGAPFACEPAELVLASQCDLLIAGMLHGSEDFAEVPPIEAGVEGDPARDLLRWALTGTVPQQYVPYAQPGRLLAEPDVSLFEAVACDLQEGVNGSDLISFGEALIALIEQ